MDMQLDVESLKKLTCGGSSVGGSEDGDDVEDVVDDVDVSDVKPCDARRSTGLMRSGGGGGDEGTGLTISGGVTVVVECNDDEVTVAGLAGRVGFGASVGFGGTSVEGSITISLRIIIKILWVLLEVHSGIYQNWWSFYRLHT